MKPTICRLCALTFPLLLPGLIGAQSDISPLDGYTPGQVLTGNLAGAIPISGFEVFNPANSQMSINIPLLIVRGRGPVTVPLMAPLTNPIWEVQAVQYQYNCGQYGCQTGYGYIVETAEWNPAPSAFGQSSMVMRSTGDYCNGSVWHQTLTRGTLTAPDGTETEFIDKATNGALEKPGYNRGTAFIADNGSGALFTSSSGITDPTGCASSTYFVSGTMVTRDGTAYTITNGSVTQIKDSNGNITQISSSAITDSVGRTYSFSTGSDSNGSYGLISYLGAGATGRTIKVRCDSLSNHLAPGHSIQTFGQLWPSIPSPPTSNGPSNLKQQFDPSDVVSEIDLPDGSSYSFLYDSYANLVQITLPTGGVIQYTYSQSAFQTGSSSIPIYLMNSSATERREYSGSTLLSKMDFPGNGEIDRYDGSGNLLAKETHTITNTGTLPSYATNYNSWQYDQSSTNTYYDSAANGGGALEAQALSYFQAANCSVNCGSAQTVTTTMGSQVKQSGYAYDQYGNVVDEKDYDWGSGGPRGAAGGKDFVCDQLKLHQPQYAKSAVHDCDPERSGEADFLYFVQLRRVSVPGTARRPRNH